MKFISDFHIHSRYSRATAKTLDPEHLSLWAQKKGITVIGTGDFTHPEWLSELEEKLVEAENGLYRLKPDIQKEVDSQVPESCLHTPRFILSGEISCIYKKNGKTRKVHHLILMPDMASVIRLNDRLDRIGNIASDGRPILGLDSRDLLEITLESSDEAFFIPAHIWTPWFSLFGSRSGFDTLEECFEDLSHNIHALETGLSSDPPMNRRLSSLDKYLLVSNSDAHSPAKLGREANLFDTELDYKAIIRAMTNGQGFLGTIEFFPEEGKYHLDGHRKCNIVLQPSKTREFKGICPKCGRPLTEGVLHRIDDLSDRNTPKLTKDYLSLIPLPEVLSEILDCGPSTKKAMTFYESLLSELGPELTILTDTPIARIEAAGGPILAKAIERMRLNQVICHGGYDGQFGKIHLFEKLEKQEITGQLALFKRQIKGPSLRSDPVFTAKNVHIDQKISEAPIEGATTDPILDPLNPEQKSAVLYHQGNLLITAGPGTGKTMTLTYRIAYLVREGIADPGQILAVSFTRKAAEEMAQRISTLLKGVTPGYQGITGGREKENKDRVHVVTFHGFCLEILRNSEDNARRLPNFILCSEWDSESMTREILSDLGVNKKRTKDFIKALPNLKRASVLGPDDASFDRDMFDLFQEYEDRRENLGILDYDDLEVEALKCLRNQPKSCQEYCEKYPWVFIDEYQDTNKIQVELLKIFVQTAPVTICAIGDPDQAIYGFRGSDVSNFHGFTDDFPEAEKVSLIRNYRSTKSILKGSAAILNKANPLKGVLSNGDPIYLAPCRTDTEEAGMIIEQIERFMGGISSFSFDSGRVATHEGEASIGFGDIGILYRLNAQGDVLEDALNRAGIPFIRSGETPLINYFPINIVWRFFQTLKYPDNPYFQKAYGTLVEGSENMLKKAKLILKNKTSATDLLEMAVQLHNFDITVKETAERMHILRQLSYKCSGGISSFLDQLSLERGIDHALLKGDRIALMSLHAAKGLEWPIVFITGCEDQLIPCTLFGNKDLDEEKRLFYVGMTRARLRLILSHAKRRVINGRALDMGPSPFLASIPENLSDPIVRGKWKPKEKGYKQLRLFPEA